MLSSLCPINLLVGHIAGQALTKFSCLICIQIFMMFCLWEFTINISWLTSKALSPYPVIATNCDHSCYLVILSSINWSSIHKIPFFWLSQDVLRSAREVLLGSSCRWTWFLFLVVITVVKWLLSLASAEIVYLFPDGPKFPQISNIMIMVLPLPTHIFLLSRQIC